MYVYIEYICRIYIECIYTVSLYRYIQTIIYRESVFIQSLYIYHIENKYIYICTHIFINGCKVFSTLCIRNDPLFLTSTDIKEGRESTFFPVFNKSRSLFCGTH